MAFMNQERKNKLAEARVAHGGIPAAASIYHKSVEIRRYNKDHGGNLFYTDNNGESHAPKP